MEWKDHRVGSWERMQVMVDRGESVIDKMKKVSIHPEGLKVGDIILWDDSKYTKNVLLMDPNEEGSGLSVLLILGPSEKNKYSKNDDFFITYDLDVLVLKNKKDKSLQGSRYKHWAHPEGCEMWLLA